MSIPSRTFSNIQVRRGTKDTWLAKNPILLAGEIGFESDTNKLKIGNGTDAWNSLPYFSGSLADLSDVDSTVPVAGQALVYDGDSWGPAQPLIQQASTTQSGIVELATNAETQTGTDATRAVTPASLTSRTATESRSGIVELATNAEVLAGTDSTRVVTPSGLSQTGVVSGGRIGPVSKQVSGDWNSYTENGWYDGPNLANAPRGDWIYVHVQRHSNGPEWVVQNAYDFYENRQWTRRRIAGTWGSWLQVSLRGSSGVPFAMAAGIFGPGAYAGNIAPIYWSGLYTVTFPSGRFSVPPIVTTGLRPNSGGVTAGASVEIVTATSFATRFQLVGSTSGHTDSYVHWHAIQMTATTAAG